MAGWRNLLRSASPDIVGRALRAVESLNVEAELLYVVVESLNVEQELL